MTPRALSSLIIVLVCCTLAASQGTFFGVRNVKKGKDFSFPIFSYPGKQRSTIKINHLLQLLELRSIAKGATKDIFRNSEFDDGTIYGGKVIMQSTVYSNNDRVLSIEFDQSACGMTCAYWHNYYNFNSGNGDLIQLKDLFTPNGFDRFAKIVISKRSSKYRREVKKKIKPDEKEDYREVLGTIEKDELSDFYIRTRSIVIDGENCLIKGRKFDGLNMYVRFDLDEFKPFLNNYGRAVFGLDRVDISKFRSNSLPQLFEGKLNGSIPIEFVLIGSSNNVVGVYAYSKHGEGITLTGSLDDGKFQLTEHYLVEVPLNLNTNVNHRLVVGGSLSGRFNGITIEGEWSDKDRTKSYPFSLSRN
jgi:hypothetical protein